MHLPGPLPPGYWIAMRKSHKRQQVAIFSIDLLLMYLSLFLALVLRNSTLPSRWALLVHFEHFTALFLGWTIVFYTLGMYRLEKPFDSFQFLKRTLLGALISGLASAGYFYIIPSSPIEPKTVLFLFVLIFTALFWTWRYTLGKLRRLETMRIGVGFLDLKPASYGIVHETLARSALGYDIKFIYNPPEGVSLPDGVRSIFKVEEIRAAVEDLDTDLIVLGEQSASSESLQRALFGLLDRKVRFMRLSAFYELVVRRVPVGIIDENWFLENIDLKAKIPYEYFKRGIDLIIAVLLILVTAPFWPFIALAIKLSSKGPVFFTQTRLGRYDKPFTILKFRTMRQDDNSYEPTQPNDARITGVGAFLRASRWDEIPQVINILRGEMSFVGPRPERPEIAFALEKAIPYYSQRHLVKPGVTGWDQVSGEYHSPSVEDTYEKLQYDLYYLKNMSLYLDVSIFFKTIMTVFRREGR